VSRDPFDVLEQQLRSAAGRPRRRPWIRSVGAVGVAVALVGGGVAVAAGVFFANGPSPAAQAAHAGETAAGRLPLCSSPQRSRRTPQLVSDPVDPAVRARFAVFRRHARASDRVDSTPLLLKLGGGQVLRNGVRVTRAASGRRFALVISYGRGPGPTFPRDPIGCRRAATTAALAQPQAADPAVRARVQGIMDKREQRVRDLMSGRSQYLTFFSLLDKAHRSGGGGTTLIKNGRLPNIGSVSAGGVPHKVRIDGLVPDEVDHLQIVDRDGNPSERSIRVPVSGNVYDVVLPRRMGPRMLVRWRASSGRTIRTVHLSY
jgi:hypothetical protein